MIHVAVMDVFEAEPLPADSPLMGTDNLILTPHMAAISADTGEAAVRQMFDNIVRVSRGEPVPNRDVAAG